MIPELNRVRGLGAKTKNSQGSLLKNLKLGPKFVLSLLLISIVPLAVISIFYYYYSKSDLEGKTIGSLQAINDSRAAHINHLIQLRQEQAKSLAGTFVIRQLRANGANPPEVIKLVQAAIESVYQELKFTPASDYQYIDQESDVEVISVWDIFGNIVANTNKSLIGKKEPFTFLQLLYDQGAYFKGFEKDPFTNEKFLTILEAVRNWDTGEYAGVMLLKTNARIINDITTARKGLGETAETYLVDKKFYMITESRFVKNAVLNVRANTEGTRACFNARKAPKIYRGYQGGVVLGVQKYLPDQDWCLVTEIDAKEAFSAVIAFRNQIMILVGCLIFFIAILVHLAGRAFIRPIVDLRNASREVAQGNYQMEITMRNKDEIGELSNAFNEMTKNLSKATSELEEKNKKLEKLDKVKSEFVATVSHELRTPMTIIKESISQITDGLTGEVTHSQEKLLTMALSNINRLGRIINNLLDISKIEDGKVVLNKEPMDLAALAQEVADSFKPQARKKGLILDNQSSNEKIEIYLDKDKIIQVFTNLIGNAIKFSQEGYIVVSVIDKSYEVECSVSDSGKGIAREDIPKVFDKFQQFGRQSGAGEKGTGLGLAISKGIVELHQGKIWVESRLNEGAKFVFTLPRRDTKPRE